MLKVFGMSSSGNCYKVKLLLEQLQQPYRWEEIDIMQGATRTADFRAMNPNGKVPTLEIEPGVFLAKSNAILCYLADATDYWPVDKSHRAEALQWRFFEQYSHEPYIAVARFICKYLPPDHARRAELPRLWERGYQALNVMEHHLAKREFFVDTRYSIADIALFAYTHRADNGGFDLGRYPAIQAWMQRIVSQPRFVAMS
ncbi:MAG: glutathione S-transferase family protein [Pseudomonadota bacterium]|nr:glutathione S-transferase family protein [Pseudomonadota bacterium]